MDPDSRISRGLSQRRRRSQHAERASVRAADGLCIYQQDLKWNCYDSVMTLLQRRRRSQHAVPRSEPLMQRAYTIRIRCLAGGEAAVALKVTYAYSKKRVSSVE